MTIGWCPCPRSSGPRLRPVEQLGAEATTAAVHGDDRGPVVDSHRKSLNPLIARWNSTSDSPAVATAVKQVTPEVIRLCTTDWCTWIVGVTVTEPRVRLDDQLCFSLYRASRALTARYRPMLEELGVTYPQYLVLMALWEADDQTVRELSDRLDLDSGTMSPMLKRLAALGFLTRERSAVDERLVRIRLTEAGRALEQPAHRVSTLMLDVIALDPSRLADLKDQLDEISERVSPASEPASDPATGAP